MKELLKELERDIKDCVFDAGDGGDNVDIVDHALSTLKRLKEKLTD